MPLDAPESLVPIALTFMFLPLKFLFNHAIKLSLLVLVLSHSQLNLWALQFTVSGEKLC